MIRSTRITQNTQSIPIILMTRSSPITPISSYASVKSIVRRSMLTAATCTFKASPRV